MSDALKQNLKKYFLDAGITIVMVLLFLLLIFVFSSMLLRINNIVGLVSVVVFFIAVMMLSRYIRKKTDKRVAPQMDFREQLAFNGIDTVIGVVILFIFLMTGLWLKVNPYFIGGAFIVLLVVREYPKWRDYFQKKQKSEWKEEEVK